jgi:hypothetical protein
VSDEFKSAEVEDEGGQRPFGLVFLCILRLNLSGLSGYGWLRPDEPLYYHRLCGLSFDELAKAVYNHTKEVIAAFKKQGTSPDIVQIGNEINNGFLWPDGKPSDWDKFTTLLKAGIKGAKDADPSAKIMVHIACGGQNEESRTFIDNVLARGVRFDILGQSYYPAVARRFGRPCEQPEGFSRAI